MAMPLPSRVLATYFTLWGGGSRITSVPLDYNMIYLFHSTPSGGGAFQFDYGSAVSTAEIATCRGRGQRVVMTVGGANAGYNFQTRTESQAFIDSFKRIVTSLGGNIDGCDFNNFEAHVGSSATELTWIAQQLKAFYGNDFSITCPPSPGAGYAPMDRTLTAAMSKAGILDYAGPQFYDSADLTVASTIISLIDEWVINNGDERKVVIGLSSNYAGGPTLATSQQVWKSVVAKHPNIRGVFAWSAQDDAGGGWTFGKTMAPLVKTGSTTPAPSPAPVVSTPPVTSTSSAVTWVAGTLYTLGTVVIKGGKYYKLGQVDATGTSNGTDPVVSTWYWQPTNAPVVTAPAPSPAPIPAPVGLKVGDRVTVSTKPSGTIISVSGTNATVQLDNGISVPLSTLTKI